jgi:predicted PurR-regulated permease PerM
VEFVVQILIVIFTAILGAIGWILKMAITRLIARGDSINKHLSTLNGNVQAINTWQTQHEGHDNERHQENLQKFDAIFDAMTER